MSPSPLPPPAPLPRRGREAMECAAMLAAGDS